MTILQRYVIRSLIWPSLLGLGVVTALLSMDFLLDYLDLFIGKGIPFLTVARMYILGLGWMLALSVPCAVLVGVLMTYGRMAQDNEALALQAGGVSLTQIIMPSLILSVIIAAALALFNNYILPDTNHAFANLIVQVNKTRPTAQIQEGVFIDDFPGYTLFISRLDDRSGRMQQVMIFDSSMGSTQPRTILAKQGFLHYKPEQGILVLELEDGEVHEAQAEGGGTTYRRLHFERQTMNITDNSQRGQANPVRRSRGQREMSIPMMVEKIEELHAEAGQYEAERDTALATLGLTDFRQLPGPAPKPLPRLLRWIPWLRPATVQSVLPDSMVGPKQRRWVEEARRKELQVLATGKRIAQFKVEIQKKFSIPAACIIFVLLGAPLGIQSRRGGMAAGFISVGFFLFYYLALVGGEQLADRAILPPWVSMWLPNIILGLLGIYLTWKTCAFGTGK
ncbi:MAG: LptF/LptG family permease [Candidatus Eisenbacteria bacterium]|uniref:LptF/LptG family permease n=1 Tax=Eiseniibacteriota bacterium TaxID=2212470 RepID=A0A948W6G1_UNCEI|nr:LptF/LptG family permease [Candidatus Eisenbacteria bacterium]MBU1951202.1 LptF/LptG family permease [Candidatus Eisenbacteria bacterium]MBU2690611.1 LptF/LptG family permease [Candidatus Eisenbacteria bacterium]